MGAGQSSAGGRQAQAPEVKTSYYELLGVDKSASDDDIKKAYRRKALELHPDRNYGDVERATALFAAVQSAYEVLSDPQERAWYDAHEDAILRDVDVGGGDGGPAAQAQHERALGLTTADDITRLLRRFTGSVAYTDAPTGFYGFLRETFAQLAREEELAARRAPDAGQQPPPDYPSFGHKDDTHEDVVRRFYAAWAGFATRKTFAWRERYRRADAADRWTRRAMDKENRRLRGEGAREYNDAVRSLVAFVRKRDPRFRPSAQSWEERDRVLRDAAAAQAARSRAENQAKLDAQELPAWVTGPQDGREEELAGSVGDDDDEESEEEQFECVACRKTFKSEKQFEAHERSKKHVKAVQALRRKMKKEGVQLDIDESDDDYDRDTSGVATPLAESNDEKAENLDSIPAKGNAGDSSVDQDAKENSEAMRTDDEVIEATASLHLNGASAEKAAGQPNKNPTSTTSSDAEQDSVDESDAQPPTHPPASEQASEPASDTSDSNDAARAPKMGKAAQKRAKRAAAASAAASATVSQREGGASEHRCGRCGAQFPSKTRLFQHIRDLRHAEPVLVAGTGGGGGGGRGGKKVKGGKR